MKSKVVYIVAMLGMLVLCIFFGALDVEEEKERVHQHLNGEPIEIIQIKTGGNTIPGRNTWTWGENGMPILNESDRTLTLPCELSITENSLEQKEVYLAEVKCRGNSSRWFDKGSYMIHFTDKNGNEERHDLAGMEAHNEWVLNGPFLDKTLIRNYVCYNVAGEIMDFAPDVRFCELYIDEEYQGIYLLTETVTRGAGRLNLTKADTQSRVCSYIIHLEREKHAERSFANFASYTYKSDDSVFEIRYPGATLINENRIEYISDNISSVERILYTYDLESGNVDYADYIDIDAFAEYFVINEFFGNKDAGWYSTYFYKDVRGKLKPCVWDFNNACDNYQDVIDDATGFELTKAPWFNALIKDEDFVDAVVETYCRLRKEQLSDEYLQNYIDETILWLGDAVERNYDVWGYTFEPETKDWFTQEAHYLMPLERNPHSYEEAVTQLKDYITRRGEWLDENIDNLYQYCHDSRNANDLMR